LVSEEVGKVDNAVARPQTTPSLIAALAGPFWPSESFSGSSEIINSRERMRFWNHLWRRIDNGSRIRMRGFIVLLGYEHSGPIVSDPPQYRIKFE
jgi:hypothetical protein